MASELTFYDPGVAVPVLPTAARQPWVVSGAGGTLTGGLLRVTASAAANTYTRFAAVKRLDARMAVQAQFRFLTGTPAWASGASGHLLWIDDGRRKVGVSIGSVMRLVNPTDGAILHTLEQQPGGATSLQWYALVKVGQERWEVYVDGVLVLAWPYVGGALSSLTGSQVGFGWADASGSGSADWGVVETAVDGVLAPGPMVARHRDAMPGPYRAAWSPRHEALLRASVGLSAGVDDALMRVRDGFTAGTLVVESSSVRRGSLPGTGWTLVGSTSDVVVVRERLRFNQTTTVTYARYDLTEPIVTATGDADRSFVWAVSARVRVDAYATSDTRGRVGPFLTIRDGTKQVGAILVEDRGNPALRSWVLSDANPSTALGVTGQFRLPVDPEVEHLVELFVVGADRVLLFVDGQLVEDKPYADFVTVSTTDQDFRVGRDGSSVLRCRVDFSEVAVSVSQAHLGARDAFWHRINERLLFRSGCERNDRLEVWLRHRGEVFLARGTERVLNEIRRVACDDTAELVVERMPTSWYLNLTYPGVTPTFIAGVATTATTTAEFGVDDAPNFTPTALEELVTRYLLPHSAPNARFETGARTVLTGSSSAGGGGTQFAVASFDGFAVGDSVELRKKTTGTVFSVTYDSDEGLVDLLAQQVRDFSGNDHTGTITGSNATVGNTANFSAVLVQANLLAPLLEGIRSPSLSPVLASGFTYAGRFTFGGAHTTNWWIAKTTDGVGTGGFRFFWASASKLLTFNVYSLAATKTVTYNFTPAGSSSFWLAARWDPATNLLSIFVDGVKVADSTNAAFTVLDPPAGAIGFGCAEVGTSNYWRGNHRDHYLYERALTDAELETLYEDEGGREAIRFDAAVLVSYLPRGWPAVLATHADDAPPLAADTMVVAANAGSAWATWGARTEGTGNDEIVGTIELPGLDSHKLANVTAGGTVHAVGASAGVAVTVEVFGTRQSDGAATTERLVVAGTTPTVGTVQWATVHGIVCTPTAQADVSLVDVTSTTTLFTIPSGSRSRGVHLFDPPLFCGPARVTAEADGATTAVMQVWGVEEKLAYRGYNLTLNGTTPVTTTMTVPQDGWDSVRVLAMGYVAAARTVTLSAVFVDPVGDLALVSSSGSDTMRYRVLLVDTMGVGRVFEGTMAGAVTVNQPTDDLFDGARIWHILGFELLEAPVGTVTLVLDSGAPSDVLVATLAPGQRWAGVSRRKVDNVSDVRVRLNQAQTTARYVGVYGTLADGTLKMEVVQLAGTDAVTIPTELRQVLGLCTGHVPSTKYLDWEGEAWRFPNAQDAFVGMGTVHGWTTTGAYYGVGTLGTLEATDATLAAVALPGTYSQVEATSIIARSGPTVTVNSVALSYASGDVMRKA